MVFKIAVTILILMAIALVIWKIYDCDGWKSPVRIEYQYKQDNLPVSNIMVIKWEDTEWHQPTREYMGLE